MTGTAGTAANDISGEPAREAPAQAPTRSKALVGRTIDFWLLGGASIVLWVLAFSTQHFRHRSWAIDHHFANLLAISGTAALVCNYPHFMASYRLAYGQGVRYVAKHWWQLVVVPLGLVALLGVGYHWYARGVRGPEALKAINTLLVTVGLKTSFGVGQTGGAFLMGMLLNVMYFTVGWHYSKQIYGCMMVYGAFDKYRLTDGQKRLLRWSCHSVWYANWIYLNSTAFGWSKSSWDVWYANFGFPRWVLYAAMVVWAIGFLSVGYFIVYRIWRERRQLPSANWLVPYLAFTVWWLPGLYQVDFTNFIVPFFHSLQYLAFVYKVENERMVQTKARNTAARGAIYSLILVVTGFVSFELFPNILDNWMRTEVLLGAWIFGVSAQIFINVHHYFIDNVIWRFSNKHVKEYLIA